jgi:hypothetical protein
MKLLIMQFSSTSRYSSLLGPNILFSTLLIRADIDLSQMSLECDALF